MVRERWRQLMHTHTIVCAHAHRLVLIIIVLIKTVIGKKLALGEYRLVSLKLGFYLVSKLTFVFF